MCSHFWLDFLVFPPVTEVSNVVHRISQGGELQDSADISWHCRFFEETKQNDCSNALEAIAVSY